MRRRLRPLAAAFALAVSTLAPRAEAHEHRWHLGGSLGFSQLFGGPTSAGITAGAQVAYELTDMFNLMGSVNTAVYPYGQWAVVSTGVGVGYVVDTFHWVPYVGALAGPAGLFSTDPLCGLAIVVPCRAFRVGLEIPFGLDYQLTRRLAVGFAGRYQLLLLGAHPWTTLSLQGRVEYSWGR
ncbi:hypothetical protein A7982_12090 [Minicystis rosea]|nr:hypothetical protein A7982_12090 [Minicystis rosea]